MPRTGQASEENPKSVRPAPLMRLAVATTPKPGKIDENRRFSAINREKWPENGLKMTKSGNSPQKFTKPKAWIT
jgi:hypothetical protein